MAEGGKAFICLHATRESKGHKAVSNIVPVLELGDMVTVPASDVSYVVTEYGLVNMKGMSVWQRAKALISIAHPQFRDELTEAACKAGFITKGTEKLGW
jgi:acyl-CoA hydrolase